MENSNIELLPFCPHCGTKSFIVNDEKSFICEACSFVIYLNAAGAVAGIIKNKNAILLTRRAFDPNRGMLDLPGGFIDYNESAEEALIREIKEELQLIVTECTYLTSAPNTYLYKDVLYNTIDLCFHCEVESFNSIKASDDVEDYVFLNESEIDYEKIAFGSGKYFVKKFFEK